MGKRIELVVGARAATEDSYFALDGGSDPPTAKGDLPPGDEVLDFVTAATADRAGETRKFSNFQQFSPPNGFYIALSVQQQCCSFVCHNCTLKCRTFVYLSVRMLALGSIYTVSTKKRPPKHV